MPVNVAALSIAAPSILQTPDLPHHQLRQILGGPLPVEDLDAVGFEPDQSLEPLLHAPPELIPHLLDPVERRPELPGAPRPLLGTDTQVERPVRDDALYSPGVELAHRLHPEPPAVALVGQARVEVSLAHDVLAAHQTRQYPVAGVVRARGRIQVRLGPGIHLDLGVEHERADALSSRGAARLPGEVRGRVRVREQRSQGTYERGLAGEIRPLDSYEDAPRDSRCRLVLRQRPCAERGAWRRRRGPRRGSRARGSSHASPRRATAPLPATAARDPSTPPPPP